MCNGCSDVTKATITTITLSDNSYSIENGEFWEIGSQLNMWLLLDKVVLSENNYPGGQDMKWSERKMVL